MNPSISTLAAELEAAQQDLDLVERLKSAKDRVTRLTKEYEKALAAQAKDDEAKAKEAREARFQGLQDIKVARVAQKMEENLVRAAFDITYTQLSHDWRTGGNLPTQHVVRGFAGLPSNVFAYLVEKHPEQIPAEIMALAPGNPQAAFHAYFLALRRGYTTGKASV